MATQPLSSAPPPVRDDVTRAKPGHRRPRQAPPWLGRLLAGGTSGNERLTAITGGALLVGLRALGVTLLRIGPLLGPHMFIGLLLIGPVLLKMASTGYRFARYYTRDRAYLLEGPPPANLRLLAPLVVVSTAVGVATGC